MKAKQSLSFGKAMAKLQSVGRSDFLAGKPITAYPSSEQREAIIGRFAFAADRGRAAYEMGWRGAKDEKI
jgi:hypothetical protein